MSEEIAILIYIKNTLADLIYLIGIIATLLVKVTENTVIVRRDEEFLNNAIYLADIQQLNIKIIKILKRYQKSPGDLGVLSLHVLKYNEE